MQSDIDRAIKAGFSRYITKPINVNGFMSALDETLESSEKDLITEN